MKYPIMSTLSNYLERQLAAYRQIYALSVKQMSETGLLDSPSSLAIANERETAIEEIQQIESLIKKLESPDEQPITNISDLRNSIRDIIEKIISNDKEIEVLVKGRKEAITSELKGLNRGKSLSKKYGPDVHVPNRLSIRK